MTSKLYEGSAVAFIDGKGRILLHNRVADGKSRFGEGWGLIGGEREPGESKEEALNREIKEELGYELKSYRYINDYKNINPDILIHLFVAKYPGANHFGPTSEGDIRKNVDLFSYAEALKKSTVGIGYVIYKDLHRLGFLK